MGGMVLELELVDEFTDPVVTSDALLNPPETLATKCTPANTSNDWQIENVQVKCDLVTLDNSLQNSYDAHLLAGNAYPINYNTFITQCQNVIGGTDPVTSTTYGQQKINICIPSSCEIKISFCDTGQRCKIMKTKQGVLKHVNHLTISILL